MAALLARNRFSKLLCLAAVLLPNASAGFFGEMETGNALGKEVRKLMEVVRGASEFDCEAEKQKYDCPNAQCKTSGNSVTFSGCISDKYCQEFGMRMAKSGKGCEKAGGSGSTASGGGSGSGGSGGYGGGGSGGGGGGGSGGYGGGGSGGYGGGRRRQQSGRGRE